MQTKMISLPPCIVHNTDACLSEREVVSVFLIMPVDPLPVRNGLTRTRGKGRYALPCIFYLQPAVPSSTVSTKFLNQ
jgi:hypothetical protein